MKKDKAAAKAAAPNGGLISRITTLARGLFRRVNRGLLLDIFVFVVNLFLMRFLIGLFAEIAKQAEKEVFIAQLVLFLCCGAVFVLPPIGAVLKRWHFHERRRREAKETGNELFLGGCFFNPIFYFCLTVLIGSAVNAFIFQFIYKHKEPGETVFVSSVLIGFVLMVTHTALVYRYFAPPKHAPRSAFLRSPSSELIADICIFLNMLIFQLFWNWITTSAIKFDPVSNLFDLGGRIFLLCFGALLIYFPPRIFYLADDIRRPRTWAFILLANLPVIVRVLIGSTPEGAW